MARSKNTAKSAAGMKAAISSDSAPAASATPVTRRTAPTITAKAEPKRAKRFRAKEETIEVGGKGQQVTKAVEAINPELKDEERDAGRERGKKGRKGRMEKDVGRQETGTTEEGEHTDHNREFSYDGLYSLLPGALSPSVDTSRAMRVIAISAIASSAISLGSHMLVDWIASTSVPSWAAWTSYVGAMALPSALAPIAALGMRV